MLIMAAMKALLAKKMVTQNHEPPLVQCQGDTVKREAVAHLKALLLQSERRAQPGA